MGKKVELYGKTFGLLQVVTETAQRNRGSVVWECICECGNTTLVSSKNLVKGKTKSCGCLVLRKLKEYNTTHGASGTFEYNAWRNMKARCFNPNNKKFHDYGGRGIIVCSSWVNSFEQFLHDMGYAPENTTLDRIDVNSNYDKENCRWADIYTQNFNQRLRKNNTTNKTGVNWDKLRNKWKSQICIKGKNTFIGRFDTFEQAVKAREEAELAYMGIIKQ